MRHVAKRYGDFATTKTFTAWAEAVGAHDMLAHFRLAWVRIPGSVREVFISGDEGSFGHQLSSWRAPPASRFDAYLPWVAREFDRIYKPYGEVAKKLGLPAWPYASPGEHHPPSVAFVAGMVVDRSNVLVQRFRSIVDWAEAEHVDLNKYDWEAALAEADRWGKARAFEEMSQGRVVFAFDDGWTVQELRAKRELEDEGEVMQHCVGESFEDVEANHVQIYSLRDPARQPHATMEWVVDGGYVSQLRGKQNVIPKREYLERILVFRDAYPFHVPTVTKDESLSSGPLGWFQDELVGVFRRVAHGREVTTVGVYVDHKTGQWVARDVDELHLVINNVEQRCEEVVEYPDTSDLDEHEAKHVQRLFDERMRDCMLNALNELSVRRGGALAWGSPFGTHLTILFIPALAYAIWKQTDAVGKDGDGEEMDELVAWLHETGIRTVPQQGLEGRVVNPRRPARATALGASAQAAKARLLRW